MADAMTRRKRPTARQLKDDLDDALGALYEVRNDGSAAASVDNATAMLRVWSLRYIKANLELDTAADDHEKNQARRAMKEASAEVAEWEKRKSVAQADLVNDLLLAEKEHTAEQDALADDLEALH